MQLRLGRAGAQLGGRGAAAAPPPACPPAAPRAGRRLRLAPAPAAAAPSSPPFDVVTLSNLCVDVVQTLAPPLPAGGELRGAYASLQRSATAPTPHWEVGGATNLAIAARRLGLSVGCLGHAGGDPLGAFLAAVLASEGVALLPLLPPPGGGRPQQPLTLLCWVMVDADTGAHAFCSRFDFDRSPLLAEADLAPGWDAPMLGGCAPGQGDGGSISFSGDGGDGDGSRGGAGGPPPPGASAAPPAPAPWLAVNGFAFDDLAPGVVAAAAARSAAAGGRLLLDPGPRGATLRSDAPPGGAAALDYLLSFADVVLMTEEEAEQATGAGAPAEAAASLLARCAASDDPWVIVKRGAAGCVALTRGCARPLALPACPLLPGDAVADTVGCGDSFAAAVLFGRSRGAGLAATLALANAVGAATATGRGAGRRVAARAHVVALLDHQAAGGGGGGEGGEGGGGESAAAAGAATLQQLQLLPLLAPSAVRAAAAAAAALLRAHPG